MCRSGIAPVNVRHESSSTRQSNLYPFSPPKLKLQVQPFFSPPKTWQTDLTRIFVHVHVGTTTATKYSANLHWLVRLRPKCCYISAHSRDWRHFTLQHRIECRSESHSCFVRVRKYHFYKVNQKVCNWTSLRSVQLTRASRAFDISTIIPIVPLLQV